MIPCQEVNVQLGRLDVTSSVQFRPDTSRKELLSVMGDYDFWRECLPGRRDFSRRQIILNKVKHSRIDYCLTGKNVEHLIHDPEYIFKALSDHAALV